jgi:hypothetical protein
MITTESVIHPDSDPLFDRARVRAFLERTDMMIQMQSYGLSHVEALSRVESLTDREIALIADKMDQIPQVAAGYELDGSVLSIIGLAIYTIFMILAVYFSRTMETEAKPESQAGQGAALTK